MIYAVIDLGSNTIRMNVYRLRNGKFRLLFSKKATVGIVSYVKEGRLSREGVMEICSTLDAFRKVLEHLQIDHCSVFATASLRNIDNTEEVIEQVRKKTGMTIRLISGEEEGRLSFQGASIQLSEKKGIFIDIGGGSTEIVTFADGQVCRSRSLPIGSLNLYNRFVHDIIPSAQEQKDISLYVEGALLSSEVKTEGKLLAAAGGTARAVEKLLLRSGALERKGEAISLAQLEQLQQQLLSGSDAAHMILRCKTDRIHTLIPGFLILKGVMQHFGCEQLKVCRNGIREGYLMEITGVMPQ